MRYILAILVLTAGCIPEKEIVVPPFTSLFSVVFGTAATLGPVAPGPAPTPSDECETCGGQGWLGDGTTKMDCPDCETPWSQFPGEASTPPEASDEGGSSAEPVAGQARVNDVLIKQESIDTSGLPVIYPGTVDEPVIEADIVQQKLNRILSKLKYRPLFCDNAPDGLAAADGQPWLLVLHDKPSMVADKLLLCPAADGLVVVELQADEYRDAMPDHSWPSAALYRDRTELQALDYTDLCRSLTTELEKLK